ncbi:hypothetical protein NL676_034235 [Syzygium grande]|nr:hypothetical protein NL676_034235 [Syzygium grande]
MGWLGSPDQNRERPRKRETGEENGLADTGRHNDFTVAAARRRTKSHGYRQRPDNGGSQLTTSSPLKAMKASRRRAARPGRA